MTVELTLVDLAIGFIPVLLVLYLMHKGKQDAKKATVAMARMFLQLSIVGFALVFIFESDSAVMVLAILTFMMVAAGYLALNVSQYFNFKLLKDAVLALLIGGGGVLAVTAFGVLKISPWYDPQYLIPLAGMIFSGAMTAISLALERYQSESQVNQSEEAANIAYKAAMIPMVNSMLAVGVVSLPGMMTGQILAGVSPFIAARYQIMVMCMLFSATGLTAYLFIKFHCEKQQRQ